jgi:asparagine synthase (glutamine-hydrolysing)
MCGLFGIYSREYDEGLLSGSRFPDCLSRLALRGPDEYERCFIRDDDGAIRGEGLHYRLSITGQEWGRQPYSYLGSILLFNGEIYNTSELAWILNEKGIDARENADTEILAKMLYVFGWKALPLINGVYAFSYYKNGSLLFGRDPTGTRPLFYASIREALIVSSDSVVISSINSSEIDDGQIRFYLAFGFTSPGRSIFRDINKVLPGQCLRYDVTTKCLETVWQYSFPVNSRNIIGRSKSRLKEEVSREIIDQLPTSTNVGVMLSGGLDSTIIASTLINNGAKASYFTSRVIGFPGFEQYDEDFKRAVTFAKSSKIELDIVNIDSSADSFLSGVDSWFTTMTEPQANFSGLGVFYISKHARGVGTRVLMSGDGSDELFGGYDRYKVILLRSALGRIFRKSRSYRELLQEALKYYRLTDFLSIGEGTDDLMENLQRYIFSNEFTSIKPYSIAQRADFRIWLAEESNMRVDSASMANGVEVRVPFQSIRLIDMYYSDSWIGKVGMREGKIQLRQAFPEIPKYIRKAKKLGWNTPESKWFRGALYQEAHDLFQNVENTPLGKYFRRKELSELLDRHRLGSYSRNEVKTVYSLMKWMSKRC